MYTRPEFMKLVGATQNQLRFYERRGLLVPEEIDAKNRRRYYSEASVLVFRRIVRLRFSGFSLEEIQAHLSGRDGLTEEEFYAAREKTLTEQLENLRALKSEPLVLPESAPKRYKKPVAKKVRDG